ncbi:hypothetical protein WJX84_011806 [Apatococcus fuscideae]|uniref:Uncharacterized protein n=1 Tax=Apatococcus fuscideae TaxID=2026836 RepID=A0AAW1T695_9CHLO
MYGFLKTLGRTCTLVAGLCLAQLILPVACWWKYEDAAWQSHFVPVASTHLQSPKPEAKHFVDPDADLLSVLLAFRPSALETGNARNQLRLFSRFFEMDTLKEWIVVTPAAHLEETRSFFQKQIPAELTNLPASLFHVLTDGDCVPEFDPKSSHFRDPSIAGYGYDKWVRQQVVKLGCAKHISTSFFIVIDADMFAVHPFKASDVFHHLPCDDHVAVCDLDGQIGFRSKNDVELTGYDLAGVPRPWHQDWWAASADLMELNITMDWPVVPGVTPQTLSTHVAVQLGIYLEGRFGVSSWTGFLLDRGVAQAARNAAEGRSTTDPPAWTEYTLYFLFARHAQLFDQYHQEGTVLQWRSGRAAGSSSGARHLLLKYASIMTCDSLPKQLGDLRRSSMSCMCVGSPQTATAIATSCSSQRSSEAKPQFRLRITEESDEFKPFSAATAGISNKMWHSLYVMPPAQHCNRTPEASRSNA